MTSVGAARKRRVTLGERGMVASGVLTIAFHSSGGWLFVTLLGMKKRLSGPELVAATVEAVAAVGPWVRDSTGEVPEPSRADIAHATRLSAQLLAELIPGGAVEVRVPPFVAVQCGEGVSHRRGTPPNVVEMGPREWLRLVVGEKDFGELDATISGVRADQIAEAFPLLRLR